MDNFENKAAFITGAASGIGLSLAKALATRGANVMMADINKNALEQAAQSMPKGKGRFETIVCDVTQLDHVKAAAEATISAFGNVHILMNNAGVSLGGPVGTVDARDWRWIIDINLMGVIHGVKAFLPHMLAHGEGGYIVNTASMAGHYASPYMGPYNATKFALVGYSETMQQELSSQGIHVSIMCPGWVKSNIYNAADGKPTAQENPEDKTSEQYKMVKTVIDNAMSPDDLAELTLKSMAAKRLYIFTAPEMRLAIDARREAILKDYDACLADLA